MSENKLFRKSAMEKLASPERLDVLMQVTSPVGWIALWTIAFVLAGILAWSIFGSLPERLDGQGILLSGGGLREVRANGDGVVTELNVRLNDQVKPGQIIGTIEQGGADDALGGARLKYEEAQRTATLSNLDDQQAIQGLRSQILGQEADIDRTNIDLSKARAELNRLQDQLAKGYTTRTRVQAAERDVSVLESRLTQLRGTVTNLNNQILTVQQRQRARQQNVEAAKFELGATQNTVERTTQIAVTVEGRIVEMVKNPGDRVRNGEVIAVVEPPSAGLEPLVFVNSSTGKRILPGMEAQISPSTVKREEHGYLKGTVRSVGDFPITPDAAMSYLRNATLVEELFAGSSKLELRAALLPDPNTPSGYQWSSSSGPPFQIGSGTKVTVSVVIERKSPISKVLPFLRSTFGAT